MAAKVKTKKNVVLAFHTALCESQAPGLVTLSRQNIICAQNYSRKGFLARLFKYFSSLFWHSVHFKGHVLFLSLMCMFKLRNQSRPY